MPTNKITPEIITAAIQGYESQKRQIDDQIAELRAMLPGGGGGRSETGTAPARRKRRLSAAGRKRIADAARKRWAALRAAKASERQGRG